MALYLHLRENFCSIAYDNPEAELSTGRMDPWVGSGHDFAGFLAGRVSTSDFLVFYWLFLDT